MGQMSREIKWPPDGEFISPEEMPQPSYPKSPKIMVLVRFFSGIAVQVLLYYEGWRFWSDKAIPKWFTYFWTSCLGATFVMGWIIVAWICLRKWPSRPLI